MGNFLRKYIPFSFALWAMIVLNGLVIAFHLLVLTQIIPFDIVWAGKLKTVEEMVKFESISIGINILLMVLLFARAGLFKTGKFERVVVSLLWVFIFIFALNTIGNLFSETSLEMLVATPLTFVSSILCLRLALGKSEKSTTFV